MSPEHIAHLQTSLPAVLSIRERVAARFCERLRHLDPGGRPIFAGMGREREGATLLAVISAVVHAPRSADPADHVADAFCQHHIGFGIDIRHFRRAGLALVEAMQDELGDDFDHRTRNAWLAACELAGRALLEARSPMAA